MRRRALLTAGSALLAPVAGCLGLQTNTFVGKAPTARLSMEPTDDDGIARRVLYSVEAEDSDRPRPQLLRRLATEETAEVQRTRQPIPTNRPIYYDGTVYDLDHRIVEETPATTFSVKLDIVTEDHPSGRTVQFSDLPAADREVFRRRGFNDGIAGIGTALLYTHEQVEGSALVPESDIAVIEWDNGKRAEWVVDDSYESPLYTYRYTVEGTTPAAEFGRQIREEQAWPLSGLSAAEREVVETAISEGNYYVEHGAEPPDSVRSLAERFRRQTQAHGPDEEPEGDLSGTYLVRYDGQVYWAVFVVVSSAFETSSN